MKRNDNIILVRPSTKHGHEIVDRETGKTHFVRHLPEDLTPYEPLPIPGIKLLRDRTLNDIRHLQHRRIEDVKAWKARRVKTTPSSRKTKKATATKRKPKKIPGLDIAQQMLNEATTPESRAKWEAAIDKIKAQFAGGH